MQGIVRPAPWLAGNLDPFHPSSKRCQHNFRLYAGDRLPDTAVCAHAEPDMARCVASDVKEIWVGPPPGVAVGGPEKQQYLLPIRDAYPADLDLARCRAKERLHRGLPAHRFLKSRCGQRRILSQRAPLIGVSSKTVDGSGDPVERRVQAGGEQGAHQ